MTEILTPRELTVLRLVAQGHTNREIGEALNLSKKSIEHMLGSADTFRAIYPKIGVKNRMEAVACYTARYGLKQRIVSTRAAEHLLELVRDYLARVYQMRIRNHPQMAIEMAQFIAAMLEEAGQEAYLQDYQEVLLTLRTQALLELGTAYLETVPQERLFGVIRPVIREIRSMAKAIDRAPLLGIAYVLMAGLANITKHYAIGMTLYKTALNLLDETNLTFRDLHGFAIAGTHLDTPTVVTGVSDRVWAILDGDGRENTEQTCETLEGMDRAQGLVGSANACSCFEEAKNVLAAQAIQNHQALPTRRPQFLL